MAYALALRCASTRVNHGFMTKIAQDYINEVQKIDPIWMLSSRQQKVIDSIFCKWFGRTFTEEAPNINWCIVPNDAIAGTYASYCFGEEAILISEAIMEDFGDIVASILVHELVHHMQFAYRGLEIKYTLDGYDGCIEGNSTGDYTKYMTPLEAEAWMIQKEVMEAFGTHPDAIDSINKMLSFVKYAK